jgi:hypothetical protein
MSLLGIIVISPLLASGIFVQDIDDIKCSTTEDCPNIYTKDGKVEGFFRQLHCCRHDQGIYGRCGRSDAECRKYNRRYEKAVYFLICVITCCCCACCAAIGRCCYVYKQKAANGPGFAQNNMSSMMGNNMSSMMGMSPQFQPQVLQPQTQMQMMGMAPQSQPQAMGTMTPTTSQSLVVQGPQGPITMTPGDQQALWSMMASDGRFRQNW